MGKNTFPEIGQILTSAHTVAPDYDGLDGETVIYANGVFSHSAVARAARMLCLLGGHASFAICKREPYGTAAKPVITEIVTFSIEHNDGKPEIRIYDDGVLFPDVVGSHGSPLYDEFDDVSMAAWMAAYLEHKSTWYFLIRG